MSRIYFTRNCELIFAHRAIQMLDVMPVTAGLPNTTNTTYVRDPAKKARISEGYSHLSNSST